MDSTEVEIVAKKYLDSVYRVAINYSKNAQDAGDTFACKVQHCGSSVLL